MYPHHYLGLFPPFPRERTVFVAMSFDSRFNSRWENVIAPAVRSVGLEPSRVDTRKVSDSVVTEILGGIANCRLVLADITTIGKLDETAVRNGNVMYEVGIAHSCRLPEEVLIFRSDGDALPFDVTNVRVNNYSPDHDPETAKSTVSGAIESALGEIDLRCNLAARETTKSLDHVAWRVLDQAFTEGGVRPFPMQNVANALSNTPLNSAITRLLQLGLLETDLKTRSREFIRESVKTDQVPKDEDVFLYKITPFGKAVRERLITSVGTSALTEAAGKIFREAESEAQSTEHSESSNER